MSNEENISRLNQLTLESYNAFRQRESVEVLAEVKNNLEIQLPSIDAEIDILEREYKALVADKNADQEVRLNVMNRKTELSRRVESYRKIIADESLLIIYSREVFAASDECKNNQIEQKNLTNEIWIEGWRQSKYYIKEFA